jgi:hypothetical protein
MLKKVKFCVLSGYIGLQYTKIDAGILAQGVKD